MLWRSFPPCRLPVTVAAALFLGEPLGWRRMSAVLVGFVGVSC
jgi:drug/metabolite transporter (DMT)-like permease